MYLINNMLIIIYNARGYILTYFSLFLFSILYQIPNWPEIFKSIYGYPMIDRTIYEVAILYYNLPIDYIFYYDLISIFTREFLWNAALAYLNRSVGLAPEQIFFVISTFVIWRFSIEIVYRAGWIYLPLLVNPLIVDFSFSQLRLSCAIAIISFFWRGQRRFVPTFIAYVLCTSIHTAIFLFALMHLVANIFHKPTIFNLMVLILTGFAISIATGPMREIILGAAGDRRAEYYDMSSSAVYLLFWVIMLLLILINFRNIIYSLDIRYAIIILSIVLLNIFTDGYSTRFIAAAFPSLIISMGIYGAKPINPIIVIFIPYSILQWLYWLRIDG